MLVKNEEFIYFFRSANKSIKATRGRVEGSGLQGRDGAPRRVTSSRYTGSRGSRHSTSSALVTTKRLFFLAALGAHSAGVSEDVAEVVVSSSSDRTVALTLASPSLGVRNSGDCGTPTKVEAEVGGAWSGSGVRKALVPLFPLVVLPSRASRGRGMQLGMLSKGGVDAVTNTPTWPAPGAVPDSAPALAVAHRPRPDEQRHLCAPARKEGVLLSEQR